MASEIVTTAADLIKRLKRASGGETILVQGQFGDVTLSGLRKESSVTVAAASPGAAHFERIWIEGCENLTLAGLSCWPLSPVKHSRRRKHLIEADRQSANIEVTGSVFRGRADSDNHTNWTIDDWNEAKISAVFLAGPRCVIRNNVAIGVFFGFFVAGDRSEIFQNTVFGFSGDGLRITGNNCVAIGNRVTDGVRIDGNHPDGFQAFRNRGLLSGLVIKDNIVMEWSIRPDNPLRVKLQGISLHDGPYENIVIRDNSVAVSSPNGIRIHGARNIEVTGNRIRHPDGPHGKFPQLRILNCGGTMIVEDNQAEKFGIPKGIGRRNRKPDYRTPF